MSIECLVFYTKMQKQDHKVKNRKKLNERNDENCWDITSIHLFYYSHIIEFAYQRGKRKLNWRKSFDLIYRSICTTFHVLTDKLTAGIQYVFLYQYLSFNIQFSINYIKERNCRGNIVASHLAAPGSIPGRINFPGWRFFRGFPSTARQMPGKRKPYASTDIIWPSYSLTRRPINFYSLVSAIVCLFILLWY